MAATIHQTLLLLLTIAFISLSSHSNQSYAEVEAVATPEAGLQNHRGLSLVERICRETQYNTLCLSSLRSDTRTAHTADAKGLLRISLDLAKNNATLILGYIDNFLDINRPSSTTLNISSIEVCEEYYDDTIARLQWAADAFDGTNGEDFDSTSEYINDALINTDHCNREIEDDEVVVEELPGPLTNMNEVMIQLLHIAQDILCFLSPSADSCNLDD